MAIALEWSASDLAILKRMLAEGFTYGQILPHLPGRSRSALIGKAYRMGYKQNVELGLPTTLKPPIPVATPAAPVQASFKGFKFQMLPDEPAPAPAPPTQPPAWAPPPLVPASAKPEPSPPPAEGVLLLDLREYHCRWPINDGNPYRFCGCRKTTKSPYCQYHHVMSLPKRSELRREYVKPKVSAFKYRTGS